MPGTLALSLWGHSIAELLDKGGFVMWPLAACSVVVVALVLDRALAWWMLRLDFRGFVRELGAAVLGGDLAAAQALATGARGPIARTAEAWLEHADVPRQLRESIVQREGSLAIEVVERRLRALSTIAQVATLLGLLGTVAGLVGAFHQIELRGGQVEPSHLASGIWEALLTTVFGLSVAIPAFLAFQFFDSRVERLESRMTQMVAYLDEWTEAGDRCVAGSRSHAEESADLAARRPAAHGTGRAKV